METVRRGDGGTGTVRRLAGIVACTVLTVFAGGCDFKIHAGADETFKESVPEGELDTFLAGLQEKLGDHRSSRQTSFKIETNGDGTVAYLVYEPDFERGTATEEFD